MVVPSARVVECRIGEYAKTIYFEKYAGGVYMCNVNGSHGEVTGGLRNKSLRVLYANIFRNPFAHFQM